MCKGFTNFFLGFVLMFSLTASPIHAATPGSSEFGQRLITTYELTPEDIAKFSAHKASEPNPQLSEIDNMLMAETVNWVGPAMLADSTINPYTLVVTLTGTVHATGDITTMWRAGWKMEDGVSKLWPLGGLSKSGVNSGEVVIITKAAPSTRFLSNERVQPMLSLVKAENIELESIKVELWSGVGNTSILEGTFVVV